MTLAITTILRPSLRNTLFATLWSLLFQALFTPLVLIPSTVEATSRSEEEPLEDFCADSSLLAVKDFARTRARNPSAPSRQASKPDGVTPASNWASIKLIAVPRAARHLPKGTRAPAWS